MKDLSIKNFVMILTMMVACVNQTSCTPIIGCPPPPEPPIHEFPLVGTSWSYTDRFEEDDISYTVDYTISFPTSTNAKYSMKATIKEGTQTTSQSDYTDYTYTYNNGLVIMTPIEAGYAYLEGEITSEIKMEVINASSGKTIGVFYKN